MNKLKIVVLFMLLSTGAFAQDEYIVKVSASFSSSCGGGCKTKVVDG